MSEFVPRTFLNFGKFMHQFFVELLIIKFYFFLDIIYHFYVKFNIPSINLG